MNAVLSDYERELDRIQNSFAIVRYCLNEQILSARRLQRFFKEQDDAYMRRFTSVARKSLDTPAQAEQIEQMARGNLARRHGAQERELYRKELIHDWLGRSELLLLVAAFEHWLKDYYGRLVSAEPHRAFSKSGIQVTLAEVFGGDSFSALPRSAFFRKHLNAEVERFDHEKVEHRFRELAKKYELDVKAPDAKRIHELVELRHNISHKLFSPGAVTAVSPTDLDDARKLFRRLPKDLLAQAKKQYPRSGLFDG